MVAANTTGGVTGKMISPQSIAIACAAVGLVGKESDLFRFYREAQSDFHLHGGCDYHTAGLCLNTDDSMIVMPRRLSDEVAFVCGR